MKKAIGLSLLLFSSIYADTELDEIKQQLKQQELSREKLEAKVARLEQESREKQSVNQSASFSQNAYLPDMALIVNMSAVSRDIKNLEYENYSILGFIEASEAQIPFNKDRGFNLNYAEFAMHSSVDPYLEVFANFHLHPNEFEIGEAFVQTRALPYGLFLKAGKFKSSFGRINSKHQHSWYFDLQPIIYESLFGPDGISDAGIQLQYLFPTDTYIMAGFEALQGTNERSFGDTESNNLYVGYLKSSVDVSDDFSALGGVSIAHGKNTTTNATNVYGVDITLREQLDSYSALIFQAEYLYRDKDLGESSAQQSGLYAEVICQIDKNYSTGVRYDAITKNDITLPEGIDGDNLQRYSAMLEYKPFEFSRIRLQYSNDQTKVIDGERRDINEFILSLNIAAGAHGAHSY